MEDVSSTPVLAALGLFVVVSFLTLGGQQPNRAYDTVGAVVAGVPLVLMAAWWLARIRRREDDAVIRRIMVAGFVAKILGTYGRHYVAFDLYGGAADATGYQGAGERIAPVLRSFDLPPEATETGTEFMRFLSGVVVSIIGPTTPGMFIVFSLLAFVGLYLVYRATVLAVPDGNHRVLAAFVFLLPTSWFWTSSLGKEAWVAFGLGIAAYGAAKVLERERRGYLILVAGTFAVFMVRPHIAALIVIAFGIAFVFRPLAADVRRGAASWLIGLVIVAGLSPLMVDAVEQRLPKDEETSGSLLDRVFATADERTSQGGSEFENRPVRGPQDLPHAVLTVPFRPFPFEADNRQALIAALEGTALLLLALVRWREFASLPRRGIRRPFLLFVAAYSILFIVAFSYVGNFGLLTRQRSQMLPLLMVLLAHRPARGDSIEATDARDAPPDDGSAGTPHREVERLTPLLSERRGSGG